MIWPLSNVAGLWTLIQAQTAANSAEAMEYWLRSEETIEHISERVGYATGFALSKAIKRIAGLSPQLYRRQATAPCVTLRL